jgi:hypothetical protein
MAFTDVFGGELLLPSQLSYNEIDFSVDITLQWSREQQIGGVNVVSDFMDMNATAGSLNVDMPSASATGAGNKATFNNIGGNTFTVRDSTGGTIQSVAPGEQWVVVLTDNTTVAGTWSTFQLGASVSVASASALAGAGIKAVSTTLNQKIDSDVEGATPFTAVDGDRAKCLIYTAGAGTCNLTAAGTLGNDWWFMLRNSGSGTLNVLPAAGFIDGASSINLDPGVSTFIFTDGSDWFTVGLSTGSIIAFDFVSVAIPGSGDFTLSGANLNRISYRFTGVLTGNRKIVVPNTTQQYWVDNQTTGAFTLEIGTAAGASPQVAQGESIIFYCDATDVINAVTASSISFPVLISQGGTSGTTIAAAQSNLQVPPVGRTFNAGFGIAASGLGDLSADRTINVEVPTESQAGAVEIATQAEVDAGSDDIRYVTPLKLAASIPSAVSTMFQKTGDDTAISTTSMTFDSELQFSHAANTRYIVEAYLEFSTFNDAPDVKFDFSGNGAVDRSFVFTASEISSAGQTITQGGFGTGGGEALEGEILLVATDPVGVTLRGWYESSGSSGTAGIRFAQINSDINPVSLKENSWMRVTEV